MNKSDGRDVFIDCELKNRNCPSELLMCFILLQTKVSSIYKRKTVNDSCANKNVPIEC